MTTNPSIRERAREELLAQLQGYLKNWAIVEPEASLILGNVRRMLAEYGGRVQEETRTKLLSVLPEKLVWKNGNPPKSKGAEATAEYVALEAIAQIRAALSSASLD